MAARGVGDAAIMQIFHEPGLVDGLKGTKAHGHGRELPKVGQQPGVRVGGQAVSGRFLAEVFQMLLVDAALDIGAGIDAGRRMALEHDQIAAAVVIRTAEEMVEADLVQGGGGLVAGDVAADAGCLLVGAHDTGHGVPADQVLDPAFHRGIARMLFLEMDRDGVHIGGGGVVRQIGAGAASLVDQTFEQIMGPFRAFFFDDRGEGVQPFTGFLRVDIRGKGRHECFLRIGNKARQAIIQTCFPDQGRSVS